MGATWGPRGGHMGVTWGSLGGHMGVTWGPHSVAAPLHLMKSSQVQEVRLSLTTNILSASLNEASFDSVHYIILDYPPDSLEPRAGYLSN